LEPNLATLSDSDLKEPIDDLQREEQEVSYRRRQKQVGAGESPLSEVDVDRLSEVLAGNAAPPSDT
jgi:hypothetical protein